MAIIGVCYANGLGAAKNEVEVAKWWRKAAQGGEVNALNALNALAWTLATSEDSAIRDGSNAVVFAEKAVSARNHKNPAELDTLAAAYAEVGQFEKAVRTEHHAETLPDEITSWIELWLKQKSNRPAVLLALLDPLYLGTSGSIQVYLREVARRGKMEFLVRTDEKSED